jgi:protein-S-isoprenylcysteine O-methyltransferase Ste14
MKLYFEAHAIATVLFAGTMAIWTLGELRQGRRRRSEATKRDRGSRAVIGLSWIVALILASQARTNVTAASFPGDAVTFGIGFAIVWAGIGLRWWSIRMLGRYFTFDVMTSADQPVITAGPYRVLRHPGYAGLLLVFTGIGVTFANWLSLAALILLPLVGLVYRIRVEEAALSENLGDAYKSYASARKRLIPFVW